MTPLRAKEKAMNALMALPELKAWSQQIEKYSGGKVHGALIEYDPALKVIDGKRYFQFSFVENATDAARRWESFLVAESGDQILVDDAATDKTLTLEQWRSTDVAAAAHQRKLKNYERRLSRSSLEAEPDSGDMQALVKGLTAFNASQTGGDRPDLPAGDRARRAKAHWSAACLARPISAG